jgi:hypothetical protein
MLGLLGPTLLQGCEVDTKQGTLREPRELAPLDGDDKEATVLTSTCQMEQCMQ